MKSASHLETNDEVCTLFSVCCFYPNGFLAFHDDLVNVHLCPHSQVVGSVLEKCGSGCAEALRGGRKRSTHADDITRVEIEVGVILPIV